jgi:ribonuclease J
MNESAYLTNIQEEKVENNTPKKNKRATQKKSGKEEKVTPTKTKKRANNTAYPEKQGKNGEANSTKKTRNRAGKAQQHAQDAEFLQANSHKNGAEVRPTTQEKKNKKGEKSAKNAVKIIFLGGVGEIGKNMTALECGDDIIIIDAGIIFPTESMPGIDLVAPDISYLVENKHKIRALLLTHGHEDHIGGVPYLLKEIKTPIVGTKLTLALVDNKLQEHRLNGVNEITIAPGDKLAFGCFQVTFVNVNHSIAGAVALAIQTPQGLIFHSGDYKIDLTPVAGSPIDLQTITELGNKGVLLYMGESTNIERPGFTMSEKTVGATLDRLFGENEDRRIIIATFASNVHRLQQIVDLAVKYRRKVALTGRSMFNVVEAAEKIGEIDIPEGVLIDMTRTKNLKDSELVIVSTGSQGEPMSALTRMANGESQQVTVGPNDTIIISASPIPGNERSIYSVINNLYRKGAEVVYESLEKIHVSGHACREEHKLMHTLLKPKFFIPVHGEYRHLKKHAELAEELGMRESNIFIPDIGNVVELTSKSIKKIADVPAGSRLIDGEGFEDEKTSVVLQDRKTLAAEGLFIVSVAVSGGEVISEPVINSRGFVFDFHRDYNTEMREVIDKAIQGYDLSIGTVDELKRVIKKALRSYLLKKTKQAPMVVPVVVEL